MTIKSTTAWGWFRDRGPSKAYYDKWHLVPFGEYQPAWLPMQILPGQGFTPGTGPKTLHILGMPPVGPIICYESVFSGQIIREDDRPSWIALITNDAWFGNSSGPRQHLAASRLRAVEEGLPLARGRQHGHFGALFDPAGREIGRIGAERQGIFVAPLPGAPLPKTIFAHLGLWAPAYWRHCASPQAFCSARCADSVTRTKFNAIAKC